MWLVLRRISVARRATSLVVRYLRIIVTRQHHAIRKEAVIAPRRLKAALQNQSIAAHGQRVVSHNEVQPVEAQREEQTTQIDRAMKKMMFYATAMLFAVACGGNTNAENKEKTDDSVDRFNQEAQEAIEAGKVVVSEFAEEAGAVISERAEEVSQRAKASLEQGEEIYNKTKMEVKAAADAFVDKSLEVGSDLMDRGAEALESGSEALQRAREADGEGEE